MNSRLKWEFNGDMRLYRPHFWCGVNRRGFYMTIRVIANDKRSFVLIDRELNVLGGFSHPFLTWNRWIRRGFNRKGIILSALDRYSASRSLVKVNWSVNGNIWCRFGWNLWRNSHFRKIWVVFVERTEMKGWIELII